MGSHLLTPDGRRRLIYAAADAQHEYEMLHKLMGVIAKSPTIKFEAIVIARIGELMDAALRARDEALWALYDQQEMIKQERDVNDVSE